MRISDWSSDVCSSDLPRSGRSFPARATISSPSSSRSVFERLCDNGPGPQSDLPNPAPTDDGLPSLAAVGLNSRTISFKPVEIWGTGDARADHHADAGCRRADAARAAAHPGLLHRPDTL